VNPTGSDTSYRFQYGRTTAYGQTTPPQAAGSGKPDVDVSARISRLSPGTTYHFRVVATNEFGTTAGADRTFRTGLPPQCADGRDNDRDAKTDFPRDPGCSSRQDNNESNPPPCTITRGSGDDIIRGTAGRDVICAGAGNDIVYGRGGNDTILGQGGNDNLRGGEGDDRLVGGSGRDILRGQAGDDRLVGGSGEDLLSGQGGRDALDARDGVSGNDSARGGPDADSCPADPRDMRTSC
jgi:hypothetical protein